MFKTFFSFILFLFISSAFAHQGHNTHLGQIYFPTSGSKVAQPFFESGVMWLHSFEYKEARADFQQAIKLDPNFAMAYWGEAMTYNHPLWSEQDRSKAIKILNQLAPTADERVKKAKTLQEKGFIHALNLLYGDGDKKTRDGNYVDAMRQLYQENPDNDEIASFYALSILGSAEGDRDFRTYMQAAGIEEEIYSHNPSHPGALHYLIHSYDDPIHAPLGLRAARIYAKTAPDASHALHMPSHIFLALGLWDDVIASNKAAWLAGLKQNMSNDPKNFTIDDLHALEWLSYGYLEKKQYKTAYQLTKQMETIAEKMQTPMAKWYYAFMRASYIIASEDWSTDLKSIDMSNVELSARATHFYVNALIAFHQKNIHQVKKIQAELNKNIPNTIPKKTYPDYFTSILPSGIKAARIMSLELEGLLSEKKTAAIQSFKKATELENQMSFGYGPPIPVQPSYELLAEALLKNKKYTEAYHQYIISLKRMPNRIESVHGLNMTTQKLKENGLVIPEGIRPYFNKLLLPDYFH